MHSKQMKRLCLAVGLLGAVGVLAAGLGTSASAQDERQGGHIDRASCTPHELPVPADIDAGSIAMATTDPSGRYVVAQNWDGYPDAEGLLWVDGEFDAKLSGLQLPDIRGWNSFEAVNDSGVIVGQKGWGSEGYAPWKHESGEYSELHGGVLPIDVNNSGTILGVRHRGDPSLVWPEGNPDESVDLKSNVYARAISEDGVIVGDLEDEAGNFIPYYWPDSTSAPQPLQLPDGISSVYLADVAGDWAIGQHPRDPEVGVLWNLADGTAERLPYRPDSVNSDGDVASLGQIHRADGTVLELPPLGGSLQTQYVETVTEPGSTVAAVGSYEDRNDNIRMLTWTC